MQKTLVFNIFVTIQNPIRKIALSRFTFAHVVISPYTYKCFYAGISIYMCMALNSYIYFTLK